MREVKKVSALFGLFYPGRTPWPFGSALTDLAQSSHLLPFSFWKASRWASSSFVHARTLLSGRIAFHLCANNNQKTKR